MSLGPERERCVSAIVDLLVAGRYDELAHFCGGLRLSAEQLASAVAEHGCKLVQPPTSAQPPDFVRIDASVAEAWSVVVPLYTLEEGLSDLSLELTLERDPQTPPYGFRAEIDGLHVL